VLEYLGVPHDQPLKTKRELVAMATDDGPSENVGDLNVMFDAINNLPADDPLRSAPTVAPVTASATTASNAVPAPNVSQPSRMLNLLPAKVLAAFEANGGTSSAMPDSASAAPAPLRTPLVAPPAEVRSGAVVVDAGQRVAVPAFSGSGLRAVVETAAGLGLRVEPVGSGLARELAPAAGTMVPPGTEVVVRFAR
jgi:cell division protein FtsI (penicillin-binding protein 3)